MLSVTFEHNDGGNTVSYPALFDDIRKNHGFVDLCGRPDLAARIPEAASSPALKKLLIELALPTAPISTLGCDIGETETNLGNDRRFTAGGYVQWVLAQPAHRSFSEYDALGRAVAKTVETHSESHDWVLTIIGQCVNLKLDRKFCLVPSHWIWFDAFANSLEAARMSREALILALTSAAGGAKL